MAGVFGTYDPATVFVLINVNGVETRISGFAQGQYIQIARNTDKASVQVGGDGRPLVSYSADNSATLRLTMQPFADSNQFLQQLCDTRTQFGVSVSIPSLNRYGQTDCAIIMDDPDEAYGTEASDFEWVIFAADWQRPVTTIAAVI